MTKSGRSMSGKPPRSVVHKSSGEDVENGKKKPKKKTSTFDRALNSRNDTTTKTESSQANKRKSEQIMTPYAADDDSSGCPKPKKPSPTHSVSII